MFSGTYTSNGFLSFSGFQLIDPRAIQLSNYQAEVLNPSQIGNGTWRASGIRGTWTATNPTAILEPNLPPTATVPEPDDSTVPDSDSGAVAVPEPSSVLSLGIVALAGTILKRRTKSKTLQ